MANTDKIVAEADQHLAALGAVLARLNELEGQAANIELELERTRQDVDAIIDELTVVQRFMIRFTQGRKVIIGFAARQEEHIVNILQMFVQAHPEFAALIQPILDYDPEYASAGEIFFFKGKNGEVNSTLHLHPVYNTQERKHIDGTWTIEQLRTFAELTEPFGCFAIDGEDEGLNY